ncbi:MAG: DMT family transporter [Sandaracinaceae bacterium]|nr:DMT family transporter [Sandaracinaceae bacterium]
MGRALLRCARWARRCEACRRWRWRPPLWGAWSLFLRPTGLPGIATAPCVLLVVAVSALALVRLESAAPRWDRATVGLLVLYALLQAVNVGTFFAAMETTTIAIAVLTHCTAPVIVALLAPRIEGTRVRGGALAAIVALAGLTLVTPPVGAPRRRRPRRRRPRADERPRLREPRLHGAAARRADRDRPRHQLSLGAGRHDPPPVRGAAPRRGGGERRAPAHAGGLLPGTLSAYLFVDGLRRIGSARAAVLSLLEPLVAVLVGWLAWEEPLAPIAALGAALVLGAALWVARGERRPAPTHRGARSRAPARMKARLHALWLAIAALLAASGAAAHARPPRLSQVAFHPDEPSVLVLTATFGLVTSEDGGASWRWTCAAAYGSIRRARIRAWCSRAGAPGRHLRRPAALRGSLRLRAGPGSGGGRRS